MSDEIDEGLSHDAAALGPIDVVLACGDLPFDYLESLTNDLRAPLVFVPGNHDPDAAGYRVGRSGLSMRSGIPTEPPWPGGAINADGRVVDVAGLRIAGLGGSVRYSSGPNQYTQRQQRWRAHRLTALARWHGHGDGRGIDVVLTHAPVRGIGDGDDPAHRGFDAFGPLVTRLAPMFLLHGHVHPYGSRRVDHELGRTVVRNVVGWQVFGVVPGSGRAERTESRHGA